MLEPDKEQLLEKLKSIKGFNLDNSFELAFDKQFMVPYSSIDDVAQLYPEYGGNAIYMVLQADRLELTNIDFNHDPPVIEYRNSTTGKIHRLCNLWFFPHPIHRDALHMKIISGTLIEIGIKEDWRRRDPELKKYAPIKCSIYDLITQCCRDVETVSEYDLLYIGSSKNVYRRLKNHETILKIYRDTASARPNKEIFVWMLKPESKLYKQSTGDFSSILLSSSVWHKEGLLGIDVGSENLLFIAEAMLINYFKPEYNEQYVNKMPNTSHAVYAKLRDVGVKNLQVDLNLFMQTYKDVLSIKTKTINTNKAKHITLYGALENLEKNSKNSIIAADVMPEELYALLIGN